MVDNSWRGKHWYFDLEKGVIVLTLPRRIHAAVAAIGQRVERQVIRTRIRYSGPP